MHEEFTEQIRQLMESNRREAYGHRYTVPSPELYPFQWLWDSCFHAIILSYFDIESAQEELFSVTARPLRSGLLPHIIYWQRDYEDIEWGREERGDVISASWGTSGTSAITQPPLLPEAVWHVYEKSGDIHFLKALYPHIAMFFTALKRDRDPDDIGLLGIILPDESGEDNSPRFDSLQELPSDNTSSENLDKRIELMRRNASCKFNVDHCMRTHFWAVDVGFNAIYVRGLRLLARIADEIGERRDARKWRDRHTNTAAAMRDRMNHGDGEYYTYADDSTKPIRVRTWDLFLPLYAGLLSQQEANTLVTNHLGDTSEFLGASGIRTVARDEASYSPTDFWRGPTWAAVNWFTYKGLKDYGFHEHAATIRDRTQEVVKKSGFREYYHPETGEGLGAHAFTWGGLILDMN